MCFSTCITYISDDSSNRLYLQDPIQIDRFMSKMEKINVYYNNLNAESNDDNKKLLNEIIRSHIKDDLENHTSKSRKLYCAKWETDGPWYRVKFLEELRDYPDQLLVFFVDFGNLAVVNLTDFRVIPNQFEEFANLPYQVIFFNFHLYKLDTYIN